MTINSIVSKHPAPHALPAAIPEGPAAGLEDLLVRSTPENTLRAYERYLA